MILSDLYIFQGHNIIQRQITEKTVQDKATFSTSGSQTILVFSVLNVVALFRQEPPRYNGGVEWKAQIASSAI